MSESDMLDGLQAAVNADRALVRRGRYVNITFLFAAGEEELLVTIVAGEVVSVEPRTLATRTGVFSIRADRQTWIEHWRPVPVRNYHDLFSMLPDRLAVLEGDLLPLMQNLQYFKDVLASLRASGDDNARL